MRILIRMHDQIALAAVGPDQKQNVFSRRYGVNLVHAAVRILDGMTVDSENHDARREARILSRAARPHRLDDRALYLIGHVELLA